jgi:hypothetical protein
MVTREDLAQAETQHRMATEAVGCLRVLITGTITRWVTRSEPRAVLLQTGRVERRDVEVPHLQSEEVSKPERLAAIRALPAAEAHALETEVALEETRERFAAAQRSRRAEVVARHDEAVARELAALVSATDVVAAKWRSFEEANRQRDIEFLGTADRSTFLMPRYADSMFVAFADLGEGPMWERFKALVARD